MSDLRAVWDAGLADVAARLIPGCERGFAPCQALGFLDADGRVEAVMVFHNWHPEAGVIEISAASTHRRWLTRERLKAIFAYPFDRVGCRMAVARIAEGNHRARRIWRSLGAAEFVIPDLRGPGEAECLYTLSADAWRANPLSR